MLTIRQNRPQCQKRPASDQSLARTTAIVVQIGRSSGFIHGQRNTPSRRAGRDRNEPDVTSGHPVTRLAHRLDLKHGMPRLRRLAFTEPTE